MTSINSVLLVDKRIHEHESIVSAVKSEGVHCIVFDVFNVDTYCQQHSVPGTEPGTEPGTGSASFEYILNQIAALGAGSFSNVGIVQHNTGASFHRFFADTQGEVSTVTAVETADPTLQTWAGFAAFVTTLKNTYGVQNVDLMACALYSNPDWKYVIDTLTAQTAVTIRASTDDTGAAALGGDWFLESHTGVNLKDVYFTEAIENFRGVLFYTIKLDTRKLHIKSVVPGNAFAWGHQYYGGDTASITGGSLTSNIIAVYANSGAFAALSTSGSVTTWGDNSAGGNQRITSLDTSVASNLTSGVIKIISNQYAMVAIKNTGTCVAWGSYGNGANTSSVTLTNIVDIYPGMYTFASLNTSGGVQTWGSTVYGGGNSSSVASSINANVVSVNMGNRAGAALKNNGQVITWGDSTYGGNSSTVSSNLSSGVVVVYTDNEYTYAALKNNGNVIVWGQLSYGGNSNVAASSINLTSVMSVYTNEQAYAALKQNGSVVTWGLYSYGGYSGSVINDINAGIVKVFTFKNSSMFAALNNSGRLIVWGDSSKIPSAAIQNELNSGVVDVYGNGYSFAALKSNGKVVTWAGNAGTGGDSSGVTNDISANVVAVYSTGPSFAALRKDGKTIVWGEPTYGGAFNVYLPATNNTKAVSGGNLNSGIVYINNTGYGFTAIQNTTATSFDLSASYYTDNDRYDILRSKENRRRVNLTTLNNNVFTLSSVRDIERFNYTIPSGAGPFRIIIPDYVDSNYSITSTATLPGAASTSYIIACDESEPVTISGVTYVNYGAFVYRRNADNTFTKMTSATIGEITYNLYGGDGLNSSGIAFRYRMGPYTISAKTFGDASFNLTAPVTDSTGAFTYTSSNTDVATVTSGGTVTIVGIGTTTITATQAASGSWPSDSITGSLVVSKGTPTLGTFTIPAKNFGDASFNLTAPTSDSTGAFTYDSSNVAVATVTSGGTVTIVGVGTTTITATQAATDNYAAGTITATLVVTASLSNFTVPSKNYGDASFNLVDPSSNDTTVGFTFASSNPSVATLGGNDGRTVTIMGVGSTVITATQAATATRGQLDISATLIVSPITPIITIAPITKAYGNPSFRPVITSTNTDTSGGSVFTFSSDNISIVSMLDASLVRINGVGTTTLRFTQAASANFTDASGSVSVTVAKGTSGFSASSFVVDANKTYGDASFAITTAPISSSTGAITYLSSDEAVATITNSGVITIVGQGTVSFTASQAESALYTADTKTSNTLTVERKTAALSRNTPSAATIDKNYGDATFSVSATNESNGAFSFSSSYPSFATIDASTGVVSIVAVGSTTLTATRGETDQYTATSVSWTLNIGRGTTTLVGLSSLTRNVTVAPFTVTATSASDGAVSYALQDPSSTVLTIHPTTGLVTLLSPGSAVIVASQAQGTLYEAPSSITATITVTAAANTLQGATLTGSNTFANVDLSGASLSNANITNTNFASGRLDNTNFNGATISGANMMSAELTRVSLANATVTNTNFSSGRLNNANINGANISNSNMSSAQLSESTMINATITGTNFTSAVLRRTDLSGANVRGSIFNNADLSGSTLTRLDASGASFINADLKGSIISNSNFTNSNMTNANISGTNLNGSIMAGANMSSAQLSGSTMTTATITGTNFTSAIMRGTNLSDANARSSIFNNADLSGSTLPRMDASGASFINADLRGANLSSADFTNANMTNANISGADITNVTFTSQQKLQLLKNTNNRLRSEIQVSQIVGSSLLPILSAGSAVRDVPNVANATFKVIVPATSLVVSDTISDLTLDIANFAYFYFPIGENEYFQIQGVKYYISGSNVRNATTGAIVENTSYGIKAIRLIAGSLTIIVNSQNTLPSSSFVVPSYKINTDAAFSPTTLPTSNSSAPIVYSSSNTSIATIHSSTGVITPVLGACGYVRFTASQVATETHESAFITSNELFVNHLIDLSLPGLNQTFTLSTLAALDASSVSIDNTDATAVFYVRLSDMTNLFQYQTDSFDINNSDASDIKYYVFHHLLPAGLHINPSHAMMNKTESTGMLGNTQGYTADKSLVKHDFIRYIALRLFNTFHGVDLFKNEQELHENVTYLGETVQHNIDTILSGISTTSADESMSYDASGNKYLTNDASGNTNLCRELMRQIAATYPSRFYNNGANTPGLRSVPLHEDDSINFKLTITSAPGQNIVTGVPVIPSRTYMIKMIIKNTVNTNMNTPVIDSEMYPNSYPYSASVVTYPPTEDSSGVYNVYSPPAPIPQSRFGYNGWYYTNTTTWVNVAPLVRDRVKWIVPANTGTSTIADLQYIRMNLKVFNKTSLPFIIVTTQAGSYRKYTISAPNSLVNGTVYSFYMNFNTYAREPATIGSTNAALTYSNVGSGSFANNEVVTSIAVESDNTATSGSIEFTLASVVVGEVSGEKQYGFSARV